MTHQMRWVSTLKQYYLSSLLSVHMICLIWLEYTIKQDLRLGENILKYATNQIFLAYYFIVLYYYFYFSVSKQAFLWS